MKTITSAIYENKTEQEINNNFLFFKKNSCDCLIDNKVVQILIIFDADYTFKYKKVYNKLNTATIKYTPSRIWKD